MTIEIALSGLSITLFCVLTTLLFIGLATVIGTAMVYGFIRILTTILKHTKGGILELKKELKA